MSLAYPKGRNGLEMTTKTSTCRTSSEDPRRRYDVASSSTDLRLTTLCSWQILLLSGPPGLGKTTLAHVVARHAGYEVMEINASDARSGSIVDDRIRPALESGYAVGSTKPVLLVIDEIDGATGAGDNVRPAGIMIPLC